MIVLHHLNNSRSQRILWLLEELGAPYQIEAYRRDATTNLAPPELRTAHPLGKSPVITDGDRTVAESGAIVDYIVRRHGGGRFAPDSSTAAYDKYQEWLHYSEGSAILPLMLLLYTMRLGEAAAPLQDRINGEIENHLGYVNRSLEGQDYLMGDFSAADVQMSFVGEVGRAFGRVADKPALNAWVDRIHARPAYKKALEKGGAYGIGQ
jgi:glutathione S-transferase